MATLQLAVRWTIGDVSRYGFEALQLSIQGAQQLFGAGATYIVCVNSIPVEKARELTGELAGDVLWHQATEEQLPEFLRSHLDSSMSEGVGWKFAPLRLFPNHYELALDNDCILWELPVGIANWLADPEGCVIAADVRPCFGQFARHCGNEPRNSGIRGLPPGFDLETAFKRVLNGHPVLLRSELDEQGLQVAAVSGYKPPQVVTVEEVAICSPFPPHLPHLGRCGAHFVGLNAKQLPWRLNDRPAVDCLREHWLRWKPAVEERVRAPHLASVADESQGSSALNHPTTHQAQRLI